MPEDKMTVEKIMDEYGMGESAVYKMFEDQELPVQTYTRPMFVLRSELIKYFTKRHDNLKD